ncbi:hypothetical protein BCR39DRAFT_587264 [Naematelia encephala]|uniref:MIT domain-containing protein n=1 Tax=Naematelia encephala TaxID=71784 RepID=A0A1Y2BC01_9TREE|nr:hypothetical protein BCR39DRAFT_587264 [Naematelia encephala]
MSKMGDENPLQRAHTLSAQASTLLQPSQVSLETLQQALKLYREAADLFERAGTQQNSDDSAKRTLQLLSTQHRKLIRDVERRIASQASSSNSPATVDAQTRPSPPRPPIVIRSGSSGAVGLSGLRDAVDANSRGFSGLTAWQNPGLATLSTARAIPPFALRPALSTTTSAPPPTQIEAGSTLSPLYSSSSSSEATIDDSFLHLGAQPDSLDPFSRFWGALNNMLDEVSNPVAFATAAVDGPSVSQVVDRASRDKVERRQSGKKRDKGKERETPGSPSESFYVVPKNKVKDKSPDDTPTVKSPPIKTPEELDLENTSLRASLDALASHAQQLEQSNKLLVSQAADRDKMMRNIVDGVRKEVQKAKQGQDIMRSQLLASVSSSSSPRSVGRYASLDTTTVEIEQTGNANLRRKIRELEDEVRRLHGENEKQKGQIDKYKDRFEKLKISARAKKEAKAAAVSGAKGSGAKTDDGDDLA